MKKQFIVPITKFPAAKGRFGPREWQDWYRGCLEAVRLQAMAEWFYAHILVLSAVNTLGCDEADVNESTLIFLGARNLDVVRVGVETVGQVEWLKALVETKEDAEIILISTATHWLRLRWLCRGLGFKFKIVFGIPRPKEVVTDLILSVVWPATDILGLKGVQSRLLNYVREGRSSGEKF